MNPIHENLKIGTIGEILVQLRLLQYHIQAAPPLKDSGNDLIAIKAEVFRAIQVKTTTQNRWQCRNLPVHYHYLALVQLIIEDERILLDDSTIYLLPKSVIGQIPLSAQHLSDYEISQDLIDGIFQD